MDIVKRIAKNSVWILSARGIELVSNLIIVAFVARYLGVEEFGLYSFLMAILWISLPIINLGIPRILTREISQDFQKASNLVGIGITFNSFVVIIIVSALFVISYLFQSKELLIFLIGVSIITFISISQTINTTFIAQERMLFETIWTFIVSLTFLIVTIIIIYFKLSLVFLFVGLAAANFIGLIVSFVISLKYFSIRPVPRFDPYYFKYLFKEALPLGIQQILVQIYLYVGTLVLTSIGNYVDVGIFQAPYRIFIRFVIIPMSIMVAILPIFSKMASEEYSKSDLQSTAILTLKLISIISILISFCGFVYADEIVTILFGQEYFESIVVFRILVSGLCLVFLNIVFESLYIAMKKQKFLILIQGSALLLAILLTIPLVYYKGYLGAAFSVILSNFLMVFLNCYFLYDILTQGITRSIFLPLVCVIPPSLTLFILYPHISKIFVLISSCLIYASTLLLAGIVRKSDLLSFIKLFFNRKIEPVNKATR